MTRPRGQRGKGTRPPASRATTVSAAAQAVIPPSLRLVQVNNRHPRLRLDRRSVSAVIHRLDAAAGRFRQGPAPGELSIAFLTDAALAELHATFLDDPTPTDVITFEGQPEFGAAGEICVSADAARRQATRHRSDFSTELTLYLVHGWLHLAGYDDLQPARKRVMRAAERRAMELLRQEKRVPAFRID